MEKQVVTDEMRIFLQMNISKKMLDIQKNINSDNAKSLLDKAHSLHKSGALKDVYFRPFNNAKEWVETAYMILNETKQNPKLTQVLVVGAGMGFECLMIELSLKSIGSNLRVIGTDGGCGLTKPPDIKMFNPLITHISAKDAIERIGTDKSIIVSFFPPFDGHNNDKQPSMNLFKHASVNKLPVLVYGEFTDEPIPTGSCAATMEYDDHMAYAGPNPYYRPVNISNTVEKEPTNNTFSDIPGITAKLASVMFAYKDDSRKSVEIPLYSSSTFNKILESHLMSMSPSDAEKYMNTLLSKASEIMSNTHM